MLNNNKGLGIVSIAIRLLLSYIQYSFLTGSVICSIAVLLFIILNINPNFSFGFLQYFSFINPAFKTGTFNIGINEITQIFLVISLIIMGIINLIKIVLKKVFNFDPQFSLKSKIIFFFVVITSAYIFASLIVAFNDTLNSDFYFVFIIFYLLNLFCVGGYLILDIILKKVSESFQKTQKMQ